MIASKNIALNSVTVYLLFAISHIKVKLRAVKSDQNMENLIIENKRLKDENDEIRESNLRDAVKFSTMARQNREYLGRIEQLEKELLGLRPIKCEKEPDKDKNELPIRRKRKRAVFLASNDEETCQSKKIKLEGFYFAGPEKENNPTQRMEKRKIENDRRYQREMNELWEDSPAGRSVWKLPWKLQQSLHGHLLRRRKYGEKGMFSVGNVKVVAELTELDFTQKDANDERRHVIIYHRCKCWLVFTVFSLENPPRAPITYVLRFSTCLGKPECEIKPVPGSHYGYTATNCEATQTRFVYDMVGRSKKVLKKLRKKKKCQLAEQIKNSHSLKRINIANRRFLVDNILCDPKMFILYKRKTEPLKSKTKPTVKTEPAPTQ